MIWEGDYLVVTALLNAAQGACEGEVLGQAGVRFPVAFKVNKRQQHVPADRSRVHILRSDNATSAQTKSTGARDGSIVFSVDREQTTGGRVRFNRHAQRHCVGQWQESSRHPVHARCRNGEAGRLVCR